MRRAERGEHIGRIRVELRGEVPALRLVVPEHPDVVDAPARVALQDPVGHQPVAELVRAAIQAARVHQRQRPVLRPRAEGAPEGKAAVPRIARPVRPLRRIIAQVDRRGGVVQSQGKDTHAAIIKFGLPPAVIISVTSRSGLTAVKPAALSLDRAGGIDTWALSTPSGTC